MKALVRVQWRGVLRVMQHLALIINSNFKVTLL